MYRLLILLLASFALAQDDDKVCFYVDGNYGGERVCGEEGQWIDVYMSNPDLHDAFSSVKVPFGLQVLAFFDTEFKGNNKIFQENTPDLGSFNDQISAFVVQAARPCIYNGTQYAESGDCDKVCFYVDGNFGGTKLCGTAGERINIVASHQTLDNAFSSVRVPVGLQALAYIDGSFSGGSRLFRDDTPDLGSFDNQISSFIVQPARPCFYTGIEYTVSEDCDKVCFYANENYSEAKLCGVEGQWIDIYRSHRNLNDVLSSVKVPVGLQVRVFIDDGFHGGSTVYQSNTPNLGSFNNQISSFIVEAAEACFYSGVEYTGNKLCVPVSDAVDFSMMSEMNDTIESIKIPWGLIVKLYTDIGFQGRFTWESADMPNLGEFNNVISSLIVEYDNQVCFYTDVNYQGLSYCARPGETHTASVFGTETQNDVFSSVRVPHDVFVTAYVDYNYQGMSRVYTRDVSDLTDFSDTISSFFVSFSGTACFYTEENWSGDRFCAPYPDRIDVMTSFTTYNDRFQSVLLPSDLQIKAYQHAHYEGEMVSYDVATKSLGTFSNTISSFEVSSDTTTPYENLDDSDVTALRNANPAADNLTVCIHVNDQGAWKLLYNDSCRSVTKRYACNNIYSPNLWRISSQSGVIYDGASVCQREFGSDFIFNAPMNAQSNAVLSGLSIPSDGVWINQYYDAFYNDYSYRRRRSTPCGGVGQRACTYEDSALQTIICIIGFFGCQEPYCDEGLTREKLPNGIFVCRCPTNLRPRRGGGDIVTGACAIGGGIRKPLTGEEIVNRLLTRNSATNLKLAEAWVKSCTEGNTLQERGGWIFADPNDPNSLQVVLAPKSASRPFRPNDASNPAIDLESATSANANAGWVLVANFHTHPLSTNQEPSAADLRNAIRRNVPGIVISRNRIYVYGPECRSSFATLGDPRDYPNNGDISDFNPNARGSVRAVRENTFHRKRDEL